MLPTKPKKPCAKQGCHNLTTDRYCPEHTKQEQQRYDKQRGSAASRGYDSRWRRYRLWYLRQNPLCVKCLEQGEIVPATDVDHIIAISGPDDELFWDASNHQALCHSCHSRKTVREDGGFNGK